VHVHKSVKNYENWLTSGEVIAKYKGWRLYWTILHNAYCLILHCRQSAIAERTNSACKNAKNMRFQHCFFKFSGDSPQTLKPGRGYGAPPQTPSSRPSVPPSTPANALEYGIPTFASAPPPMLYVQYAQQLIIYTRTQAPCIQITCYKFGACLTIIWRKVTFCNKFFQGPQNLYKFCPTSKSETEKRRFSSPVFMTLCHQIDLPKSKLNIELLKCVFLLKNASDCPDLHLYLQGFFEVALPDPHNLKGASPSFILSACPPSHFFRASAAVGFFTGK